MNGPPALHSGIAGPQAISTAALVGVFVAAGVLVLAGGGQVTPSADPGAQSRHVALGWVAVLTLLVLCWAGARQVPVHRPEPGPRVGADLAVLVAAAVALPVLWRLVPVPWAPQDYVLLKAALLMVLPGIALWVLHRRTGPGVRFHRPTAGAVAIGAALTGIAAHQYLTQLSPWAPGDHPWPDLVTLIVAATATAITASFGEELFYRYWLQTRLEATLGRWPGILAASLLFGLMHLASHGGDGSWVQGAATVIAVQGVSGIALGYLWSRYRRLWLPVLLHLSMNGLLVLLHLAGIS